MAQLTLETYVPGRSPIHRWPPRQKLVSLGALMVACAMVQQPGLILPMVAVTAGLYGLSELPLNFLGTRLSYPGLFIGAVVILLPFTTGATVLGQWGWLQLRQEGLETMALIGGRFLSILTLGLILFGTTPFLTLVQSLGRLGLPPLMVDMALLTYRYLADMGETVATMHQAMKLRGLGQKSRPGWSGGWQALNHLALLVGNLLLRSYEQSERVYQAMRLRGYGQAPTAGKTTMSLTAPRDGLALTLAVLAIAVGFVVAEVML